VEKSHTNIVYLVTQILFLEKISIIVIWTWNDGTKISSIQNFRDVRPFGW